MCPRPDANRRRRIVYEAPNIEDSVRNASHIIETARDAFVAIDAAGVVASWNAQAERIFGWLRGEALGEQLPQLILPPHLRVAHQEAIERFRDTGEGPFGGGRLRLPAQHRDGHVLPVELAVSRTCGPSGWTFNAFIHDVTERQHRDEALMKLAAVDDAPSDRDTTEHLWLESSLDAALEKLAATLAEAHEAEARSRRFLADAAHQLRTPVTGIRVCAENLLRGGERSEQDRLLSDLVRETARASRLLTSLLRMASLDEGESLAPVPCNLVSICADEVDRTWSLAPHLDFGLRADELPSDEPVLDPNLVREVLANLLDNARRHAQGRVEVKVRAAAGGVEVVVWDDGAGVAAGMKDRIFERFVSLDGAGGSGLGLAIARELARSHGGELSYGPLGFVLRLPVA